MPLLEQWLLKAEQPLRGDCMSSSPTDPADVVAMTAEIVAAFVSHNALPPAELPALLLSIHARLTTIANGVPEPVELVAPTPAVSIRQSIKPDYLVCLDDGKKFKSLRRHLAALGMTPEQYRAKWSLPADYPMVAANYSAARSAMAKKIGLGQLPKGGKAATKRGRGRPRKASA
jgi:predicted transcriptional regulator